MKQHILFFFFLITFVNLLSVNKVSAQEVTVQEVSTAEASKNDIEKQLVKQKIIVQTDNEQIIPQHEVICKQTPRKIGLIEEDEITLHSIITDDNGEAIIEVNLNDNSIYTCTSKELTTKDYCWYFPYQTMSFGYPEAQQNERPIYLVGQTSPDTCNSEFSQSELEQGIENLLPSGTPEPFTNKNLIIPVETPDPEIVQSSQSDYSEITLWQWFVAKIKALFN